MIRLRRHVPAWRGLAAALLVSTFATAQGDEFDRIEGARLFGISRNPDATAHPSLTLGAIEALPNLLRETRSALLFATTDQGNATRLRREVATAVAKIVK